MAAHRSNLLLATSIVALSACASSPNVDAEWTDPGLGARSSLLRNGNVLVACEAPDVAVRNVCQDQLAAEVTARGGRPVFVAPETALVTNRSLDGQLLPGARSSNAKAILVVGLTPAATDASSPFSISLGGFGIGRSSAAGVGVTAPLGGTRVATGYSANGRVTDVSSGRLVWSASAVAPPSSDLSAQFAALSKSVLDSAEKAGLF